MKADKEELKAILLGVSIILNQAGWAVVGLAISDGKQVLVQKFQGIKDEDLATLFVAGGETIQ